MSGKKSLYLQQNIFLLMVVFAVFTLVFSFPRRNQNRRFQINRSWQHQRQQQQQQQRQVRPQKQNWWFGNRQQILQNQWNPDIYQRLRWDILPPGHRRRPQQAGEISPEERGNRFEGDMSVNPPLRKKRGVLSDKFQRWPIGIIPYTLHNTYNDAQRSLILKAMNEITSKTVVRGSRCIYFTPRTHQEDYLDIKPDVGCFSSVGKTGGAQILSLEPDCFYKGTIMHELLHSVGLWHEQSRTDRDNYVTVNYENILADPVVNRSVNFLKYSVDYIDDLGLPYDYQSIMHYGFAFFAKDPYSPTLSPRYPYAYIGQRKYISPIDVKKVQLLYGCGGHTSWDCNFEQQNTCSWKQNTDDEFDWKVFRGSTPTAFTGPSGDNTNGLGYYIFAEANRHENKVARLTSQRIPTNLYCIGFNYHMAGYTVGSLTLQAQFFGRQQTKVLFSKRGIQGDEWLKGEMEFQARVPFQLVLEAVIGSGKEGDIAVDDITVEPGFCNYKRNFRGIDLL